MIGKRITNSKEIHQKTHEMVRTNVSTETLNKKKLSMKEQNRYKKSVEEFINEHTVSYENNDSDKEIIEKKIEEKPVMARNDFIKPASQRDKKRLKSKSL